MKHGLSFHEIPARLKTGCIFPRICYDETQRMKGESSMKIIGITGPTGAGKTTALNVLAEFGCCVIDCDAVYHALLATSAALRQDLAARFGDVFLPGGGLDRQRLGKLVFQNEAALSDLNAITHRYVNAEVNRRIAQAEAEGRPGAAVDAIALLEGELRDRCDVTVAVIAPVEVRVRRIMAREGISEEYARARIAAQKPARFYQDNCGHTLNNDSTPEAFAEQARRLFRQILN